MKNVERNLCVSGFSRKLIFAICWVYEDSVYEDTLSQTFKRFNNAPKGKQASLKVTKSLWNILMWLMLGQRRTISCDWCLRRFVNVRNFNDGRHYDSRFYSDLNERLSGEVKVLPRCRVSATSPLAKFDHFHVWKFARKKTTLPRTSGFTYAE